MCLLAVSAGVFAQTPPSFEVASIRPSSDQASVAIGVHVDLSQVRINGLTLKQYIGIAYRVRPQQIIGPDWLAQERFDVAAKIPDDAGAAAQVPQMVQTLLADRFAMKARREQRDFPVYALLVAKSGLTLKPLPPDPADAARPPSVDVTAGGGPGGAGADLGGGSSFTLANNRLEMHKMTMTAVADLLTRLCDRPVVDMTGVTGRFDVTLDFPPDDYTAILIRAGVNNGASLSPQALRFLDRANTDPWTGALQTIGLMLDARKAPLDVIVIDSMQKAPTEN